MDNIPRNSILEVSLATNGKWIVMAITPDGKRHKLKMCRWWWQCQLLLSKHPDLLLVRVGKAAQKKLWFTNKAR